MHPPRALVRRSALLARALAGVLALSGCGSDKKEDGKAGGGDARTVTDAHGKRVSVPAHPKRAVPLSEPTLDAALALGVRPVGTTDGRGQKGVPTHSAGKAGGARSWRPSPSPTRSGSPCWSRT